MNYHGILWESMGKRIKKLIISYNALKKLYIILRNCQMVYKPGSVLVKGDDHSSGTFVAKRLTQPTRTTTRRCICGEPRLSLFGFAPGGVYHASAVTFGAVRSYRTLSPLPIGRSRQAVCFLWHFP